MINAMKWKETVLQLGNAVYTYTNFHIILKVNCHIFYCYFCGCFLFLVFCKFLEPNRYLTLKINACISNGCISANWSQTSRLYCTDYSYYCVEVQSLIPEGLWVIQFWVTVKGSGRTVCVCVCVCVCNRFLFMLFQEARIFLMQ